MHATTAWRMASMLLLVLAPAATGPLTLDPAATARALAVGTVLFLIFLSARALFERQEGLRTVCRGIAWIGLLLAAEAFVQRALSPASIYGIWRPPGLASNILPWGPFINRNDFAAWLEHGLGLADVAARMRTVNAYGGSLERARTRLIQLCDQALAEGRR